MGRRAELVLALNDLTLDDEAMAARLEKTYFRILGVFRRATEPDTRKRAYNKGFPRHTAGVRSSENAIVGCDETIDDLARVVVAKLGNKDTSLTVVTCKDVNPELRKQYRSESGYRRLQKALGELQHVIVCELLAHMRDKLKAIWFQHEEGGRWQMAQSAVDKHILQRCVTSKLKYLDDRSYHGRPRKQTKRRGVPEGTSIGGQRLLISRRQHINESGFYRTTRTPRVRVA